MQTDVTQQTTNKIDQEGYKRELNTQFYRLFVKLNILILGLNCFLHFPTKHYILLCLQLRLYGFVFFNLTVKLIETTLLGRKRKIPSSCTTTTTTATTAPSNVGEVNPSASVTADESAPSAKRKKGTILPKLRPGHERHRPETKAKTNLFNKIRSSEKCGSQINRSPEEIKLWETFKAGEFLSTVFNFLGNTTKAGLSLIYL